MTTARARRVAAVLLVLLHGAGVAAFTTTTQLWRRQSVVTKTAATEDEPAPPQLTSAQTSAKSERLEFRETRYFFGRVDVYLGPEFKPLTEVLTPSVKDDTSSVASVVLAPPFGMILEESARFPGKIEVLEVLEDSNAASAGVRKGDILRGTTAMALNVQRASEEDAAFSVGLSEGKKQRAFLNTDNKPFDQVMAALQSNKPDAGGPGEAALVFERVMRSSEE
eukprot:CAMPEP_0198666290 /NCGR_PEP_ID=MMETSP1467-20131203/64109_1 /TAXON_ID=1462469 /ORGANISM="unid. sp., Strain CCMP2135" /LENGTH=222 /DNA_ID=CAMNT_0044402931 /DNA_START=8 /DNA_END=676 /DNA_ORIENTATION=+